MDISIRTTVRRSHATWARHERYVRLEFRFRAANGTYRWFEFLQAIHARRIDRPHRGCEDVREKTHPQESNTRLSR